MVSELGFKSMSLLIDKTWNNGKDEKMNVQVHMCTYMYVHVSIYI